VGSVSGGVGGRESRGVTGRGGWDCEGCADSCPGGEDSCWLGEEDEVREVAELMGCWSKKVEV
jgi:hypothetical protein